MNYRLIALVLVLSGTSRLNASQPSALSCGLVVDTLLRDRDRLSFDPSRLAANDLAAWYEYIDHVKQNGQALDDFFATLPQLVKLLPEAAAPNIFERALGGYWNLDKKSHSLKLGPRRAIDALALFFINPAELISTHLRNGVQPQAAYQKYLNQIQELYRMKNRYDAHQVFEAARRLQKWLRDLKTSGEIKTNPNSFYRGEKEIIVYGSFVQGRADVKKSDVDFLTIGVEWGLNIAEIESLFLSLEKDINVLFEKEASFTAQSLNILDKRDILLLSPIVIRVTDNSMTMEVYPITTSRNATPSDPVLRMPIE